MLTSPKKTYIFIPGGWHGAWAFDPITERLGKLGKKHFSLTLPGLETEPVTQNQIINLDTHIQYVADFVLKENIDNIILCGHSYAGMVIAGVADRIPERIDSLFTSMPMYPKMETLAGPLPQIDTDIFLQMVQAGMVSQSPCLKDQITGEDHIRWLLLCKKFEIDGKSSTGS